MHIQRHFRELLFLSSAHTHTHTHNANHQTNCIILPNVVASLRLCRCSSHIGKRTPYVQLTRLHHETKKINKFLYKHISLHCISIFIEKRANIIYELKCENMKAVYNSRIEDDGERGASKQTTIQYFWNIMPKWVMQFRIGNVHFRSEKSIVAYAILFYKPFARPILVQRKSKPASQLVNQRRTTNKMRVQSVAEYEEEEEKIRSSFDTFRHCFYFALFISKENYHWF